MFHHCQDHGCSLEERGVDQKTPVELAVQKLDVNMLDMLLENGANADYSLTLNVARDGNMALMNVLKRRGHMRLDAQVSLRSMVKTGKSS